jgi:hypothetical protein
MYMRKIVLTIIALGAVALWSFRAEVALAASATGNAVQVVVAKISILNQSDLVFGSASQGDGAKQVQPGTTENDTNGSFNVTGASNTAYTIALPADGVVTMTTGAGGADRTIAVNTFRSFPLEGANGLLGPGGTQLLLVGATRAALPDTQVPGNYTGTYTVTVVY